MSENLLDTAAETRSGDAALRPEDVPEKFWDAEGKALRVDALLKSYKELEKRMSQRFAPPAPDAPEEEKLRFRRAIGVPDSPEEYNVEAKHEMCGPDADVNQKLHEAGFSCAQVQLVYDLAAERLLPLIAEAAADYEAQKQVAKLAESLGGEAQFRRDRAADHGLGQGEPAAAGLRRAVHHRRGRDGVACHDGQGRAQPGP
jgi:hypothetical protein